MAGKIIKEIIKGIIQGEAWSAIKDFLKKAWTGGRGSDSGGSHGSGGGSAGAGGSTGGSGGSGGGGGG